MLFHHLHSMKMCVRYWEKYQTFLGETNVPLILPQFSMNLSWGISQVESGATPGIREGDLGENVEGFMLGE